MQMEIFHALIQKLPFSFCHVRRISDEKSELVDFEIIEVNDSFSKKLGKEKLRFIGKMIRKEFPTISDADINTLAAKFEKMGIDQIDNLVKKCPVLDRWNKIFLYKTGEDHLLLYFVDITAEYTAKQISRDLQRFHKAVFKVFSSQYENGTNIYDYIQALTPVLAGVMNVQRCGVWLFDEDNEKLRCIDNYDDKDKGHSSGWVLSGFNYNEEYYHLSKDRYVDSYDAKTDPRLKGYYKDYISPLGITSMLDAGIIAGDEVKGVLCLEHTGEKRKWQEHEIIFACRVADQIAIMMGVFEKKIADNKLQESEARLKSIFLTAPNGMGLVKERVIIEVNEKFLEMTGYTREEVIGKDALMLYPSIEQYNYVGTHKYELIKKKGYGNVETQWKTKNGSIIDVLLSSSPLDPQNWSKGLTFSATDITDRNAKIRLEQQLAVAVKSSEFKKNFLANMSHEMRTPLTGIIGMIEILSQTAVDKDQMDYLNILRESGDNLMEIINQVLDYSKIEQGVVKLNYKETHLHDLIRDGKALFENIDQKRIEFSAKLDPQLPEKVRIDKFRIQQIIHNLISNAIKFTHKGRIDFGVYLDKIIDNESFLIRIEIKDTGIGIPEKSQKDIFTPFTQVDDSDTRSYEGVGLGLSITKKLAELHGGQISIKSEPGKGSTFKVTFTAKNAGSHHDNGKQSSQGYSNDSIERTLNILFAEDKKVNQKVIALMLKDMGHRVIIAENGKQAIEKFDNEKFDLILMDIQMPVMDGVEVVKILRDKYHDLPPIVGLSANAFEGDKEKYMKAGMDGYLTKPAKRSDLQELINDFFPVR